MKSNPFKRVNKMYPWYILYTFIDICIDLITFGEYVGIVLR